VLHYADGRIHEFTIRYGLDVRDVWLRDSRTSGKAVVAWEGESSHANKDCRGVQLFHTHWENPDPEAEVVSIDLVVPPSEGLYPIILGITLEEAADQ